MSYIGNTPTSQSFISGTDYFNGNGSTTAFTLTRTVGSVNDIEAVVENVVQRPNDAYTLSGTTITFTSAPPSGTNNVYVRYLSTTTQSITPVQNSVSYSTMNTDLQNQWGTGFKNRIINGDMRIDQRNAGASISLGSSPLYPLDRFEARVAQGSGHTGQRVSTAPVGFNNSLKITIGTGASPTAAQNTFINQQIEGFNFADLGWGTANAKTITVSFMVYSSLTGTFAYSISNNALNRSYVATYSIPVANTWTTISLTIPGDTSGTWIGATNGVGSYNFWDLGSGSDRTTTTAGAWLADWVTKTSATVNVAGTSGATWYITGVQLEVGSTATPFECRPYGTELALCQRYYQKVFFNGNGLVGYADTTTAAVTMYYAPTTMRGTPTLGTTGTASDYQIRRAGPAGTTCNAVPTLAATSSDYQNFRVGGTVASGLTAGDGVFLNNAAAETWLAFSAEL